MKMRNAFASLVLVAAASTALFAQSPPADQPSNLAGTYKCEGNTVSGEAYNGIVQIVAHEGTYRLLWTVAGGEQAVGLGISSGDLLSVSFFGSAPGVVVYRVEKGDDGPRLVGRWTVFGADGHLFPETLTKVAAPAADAPDGAPGAQPAHPDEPAQPRSTPPPARRRPLSRGQPVH